MSNLSDYLDALGQDDASAAQLAGAGIGLIADLGGAISTLSGFLNFFTSLLQPADNQILNSLATLQATVTTGFNQVETQLAAQSILDKMNAVDIVMDPAKTVFASLPDIVPALPNDVIVNDALQKCLNAVLALRDDDAKWTVPWTPTVAYTDGWSGNLWPPHDNLVFNYIYTRPQFLHAISIFLTVMFALRPSALAKHISDLVQCATGRLQGVHDKITASTGIVGTKIPTANDVSSNGVDGVLVTWESYWWDFSQGGFGRSTPPGDPRLWPFGAVETYSGVGNVDSYWPFLPDRIDGGITDGFFSLLALRIENRKKQLFAKLGFPAVRDAMIQIQRITGQSISIPPRYEMWSLRNALDILGVSAGGAGVFQAVHKFLKQVPPYSGVILFPAAAGDVSPPTPLPNSFRSIFTPV
jgi:hypothetical protein